MWAYNSVFYQIYPLGFCGAPLQNDGEIKPRILKVIDWVDHFLNLGVDAIYFSPVFLSMLAAAFGLFRMSAKKNGIPLIKIGFISTLTETATTTTAFGMKAGKGILNL